MTILEAARIVAVMLSPMVPGVSGKVYQKKKISRQKIKINTNTHIQVYQQLGCTEAAYLEICCAEAAYLEVSRDP